MLDMRFAPIWYGQQIEPTLGVSLGVVDLDIITLGVLNLLQKNMLRLFCLIPTAVGISNMPLEIAGKLHMYLPTDLSVYLFVVLSI